jgi:hypothetical protein
VNQVQRPDVLGVFVKAPIAGQVKTRLAAEVGAQSAARLYHLLGRSVVSACGGPSYDTVVWFAPRGARRMVQHWLRRTAVAGYRAQPAGSLGERMAAAIRLHFHEGFRRVILIGSDCPGIDAQLVSRAFATLDEHDLTIGPARDGGYYLIGLRGPAPRLFRGISWSTDVVLDQTLEQARRLGLRSAILPTLRDIDTAADARALRLLPR